MNEARVHFPLLRAKLRGLPVIPSAIGDLNEIVAAIDILEEQFNDKDEQIRKSVRRHELTALEQRVEKMQAALRLEGAPDAPCVQCRDECSHACLCYCHRERAEYVGRMFDEAVGAIRKGD